MECSGACGDSHYGSGSNKSQPAKDKVFDSTKDPASLLPRGVCCVRIVHHFESVRVAMRHCLMKICRTGSHGERVGVRGAAAGAATIGVMVLDYTDDRMKFEFDVVE